jgi:nitrite reductase (NADH) large subunit
VSGSSSNLVLDGVRPRIFGVARAVASRKERAAAASPRERLVIVGNGMVGQRLCERLIELGGERRFDVAILGEEAMPAYDRVHLTDVLRGRPSTELVLREPGWYDGHGFVLRLNDRVTSIDRGARFVRTAAGHEVPYDHLVLAAGSRAVLPRVEVEGTEIVPYRTLDDAQRILDSVRAPNLARAPVAVIGAGLLGIEAARTLQELGTSVVVLESASQLLPRQLDPEAAEVLFEVLRAAGMDLRLRARIVRVIGTPNGARIDLDGAPPLDVRLVVAAAGARARDDLGRDAGLRCSAQGGVEVDDELRTSDPRIYAVGECAKHAQVPHGLVAPGYAMADALATALVHGKTRLRAQHAVTRLKLDLTEVTVLGDPLTAKADDDIVRREPGSYRRLLFHKRRAVAAIVVGPWEALPELQRLVTSGRRLERRRLEAFRRDGRLEGEKKSLPIARWPDATVVCQCASVTLGTLKQSLRAGCSSPDALGRATSAGTLCGSCRPHLAALCGTSDDAPPASNRLLLPGAAALGVAVAAALVPRIPMPESLLDWTFHVAFTDGSIKQATGFGVLGAILLGLLLSARKRLRRFQFGRYQSWRTLHAILGVLALVALVAHTGFRLGNNLNLALSLVFLTSALSGALFALLPTKSPALSRVSAACRRTHDLTFWALPALITFHAMKSYYY